MRKATEQIIADAMLDRRLLLFVGAGASVGGDTKLPGGYELSKIICQHFGLEEYHAKSGLGVVSEIVESHVGRVPLEDFLRSIFQKATQTNDTHAALASLSVEQFVTTNYDCLLEKALLDRGRRVQKISNADGLLELDPSRAKVIKIHGSIDDPTSNLIITESDYFEKFLFEKNYFLEALQILLLTHVCLFVGFSLADINFRYLFYDLKTRLGREKIHGRFYSIQKSIPNEMIEVWRKRGMNVVCADQTIFLENVLRTAYSVTFEWEDGSISSTPNTPLLRVPIEDVRRVAEKNIPHEQRFVLLPWRLMEYSKIQDGSWVLAEYKHGDYLSKEYFRVFGFENPRASIWVPLVTRNILGLRTSRESHLIVGQLKLTVVDVSQPIPNLVSRDPNAVFRIALEDWLVTDESATACTLRALEFNRLGLPRVGGKVSLKIGGVEFQASCNIMKRNPGRAFIGLNGELYEIIKPKMLEGQQLTVELAN